MIKDEREFFLCNALRCVVGKSCVMYLELFKKEILVVGCGNPLLGDDGFGPAVIEYLEAQNFLSDHVGLFDAGTSVRELLFDLLLSGGSPKTLILIDAVQHSRVLPGEIICINVDQIPEKKVADYSLHQFPTTNMLKELNELAFIDIKIFVVQIDSIPEMVKPGLSLPVKAAVIKMSNLIRQQLYDLDEMSNDREPLSC